MTAGGAPTEQDLRELDDTFEYLIPLARLIARRLEREWGRDRLDLETSALLAARTAAKQYNARAGGTSLWAWAGQRIRQRILDEERRGDFKRRVGGPPLAPIPFSVLLSGDSLDSVELDKVVRLPSIPGVDFEPERAHEVQTIAEVLDRVPNMTREILTAVYIAGEPAKEYGARHLAVSESRMGQLMAEARRRARDAAREIFSEAA